MDADETPERVDLEDGRAAPFLQLSPATARLVAKAIDHYDSEAETAEEWATLVGARDYLVAWANAWDPEVSA